MIADFQRMSVDLNAKSRQNRSGPGSAIPPASAYPTYAKAAIQRRENLTRSADELRIQLEDADAARRSIRGTEKVELWTSATRPASAPKRAPADRRTWTHDRPDARPLQRQNSAIVLPDRTDPNRAAEPGFVR